MTDPVPEITRLQNQQDVADLKRIAEMHLANQISEPELSIKKLRIQVAQLENEIARLNYRGPKLWRLVFVCSVGCFFGSLVGTLLAIWIR